MGGATDAKCVAACSKIPAGTWPCGKEWGACDCTLAPTPYPSPTPTSASRSFCEGKQGLFQAPPDTTGNNLCRGYYNCWHGNEPLQLCAEGQRFNAHARY